MLRDYQLKGFNDIFAGWEIDDIIMFVLATGGGKTVTFTEVIKALLGMGKTVTLVAHREELITQAWTHLYKNGITAGVIMGGTKPQSHLCCQVGSIQTLQRRTHIPITGYYVCDEGHHAQQKNSYGALVDRSAGAKWLFVTATPYRLSGEGFLNIHKYKQTQLVMNSDINTLTEGGYLVPLDYYIAGTPNLDKIKTAKGDYEEDSAAKEMKLAPLVESYLEHVPGKCGIVFACNVSHSLQVMQQYNDAGISCEHIDGTTPGERRRKILADFRAGTVKIIVNVGILGEGFDVPNCEFVQLARPTKSLSLFYQMIGRVARPLDGLLNNSTTPADRKNRIKQSRKPVGIVLDNAGCYIDNGFPYDERDWEFYFRGHKKVKKAPQEDLWMEILMFVAERPDGTVVRTNNPKEIEGMKLIRIERDQQKRLLSGVDLREFDRVYKIMKESRYVQKKGWVAMTSFVESCEHKQQLMTPDVWEYLYQRLVVDIQGQISEFELKRSQQMALFDDNATVERIKTLQFMGLTEPQFRHWRDTYERKWATALQEKRDFVAKLLA